MAEREAARRAMEARLEHAAAQPLGTNPTAAHSTFTGAYAVPPPSPPALQMMGPGPVVVPAPAPASPEPPPRAKDMTGLLSTLHGTAHGVMRDDGT